MDRSYWAATARRRKGIRRKGIYWDYNLDGASPYEVIKGFWKRYWRRWSRRLRNRNEPHEQPEADSV